MRADELSRLTVCDRCGVTVADDFRHLEHHRLLDAVEAHLEGLE